MKKILVQIPDETIEKYGMSQIYYIFNNLWYDYDMKYETIEDNEVEYAVLDNKKIRNKKLCK